MNTNHDHQHDDSGPPAPTGSDHPHQPATPHAPAPRDSVPNDPAAVDDLDDDEPGAPCLICGQPSPGMICPDCAAVIDAPARAYVCAQCGEPAQPTPPTQPDDADAAGSAEQPGQAPGVGWAHADGTPLCPIPTNGGEQPGHVEPAADWPTTANPPTQTSATSAAASPLAELTDVLIDTGFIPDDDDPAAESGIVADLGPLRILLRRDDGLSVELYARTRPPGGVAWSVRFSPGTPVPVIAAAIRAALPT